MTPAATRGKATSGGSRRATSVNMSANNPPPSATHTRITSENARGHLEEEGVLEKESQITFTLLFNALITTANDADLPEASLRSRISALAHLGNSSTYECMATLTVNHMLERLQSIQKGEEEKAKREVEEVRKRYEAERAESTALVDGANAKNEELLAKSTVELTSLKATMLEMKEDIVKQSSASLEKVTQASTRLEGAIANTQHPALNHTRPRTTAGPGWNPNTEWMSSDDYAFTTGANNYQISNRESQPQSYASVASARPRNTIYTTEEHNQRRKSELNKLRSGEEKRDRQLLLDAEDVHGQKSSLDLTDTQLKEKIDLAINNIVTDVSLRPRLQTEIKCENITRQPKGGALLLLNSSEAKSFLTRPDICERFVETLGLSAKVVPRKFRVVLERVPITADIVSPSFTQQIEHDNNLLEGEVLSIKWIKNPKRWAAEQRHAHALIELRMKTSANDFIHEPKLIGGTPVYGSKYIADGSRCYKCQNSRHRATECLQEHDTCGTCGKDHRTDTCHEIRNLYCSTCKKAGHATWNRRACSNYLAANNSKSLHVADRYYKYYITNDSWTWESATNKDRPTRPPQSMQTIPVLERPSQGASKRAQSTRPRAAPDTSTAPVTPRAPSSRTGGLLDRASPLAPRSPGSDLIQLTLNFPPPAFSPCRIDSSGPTQTTTPTQTTQPPAPAPLAVERPASLDDVI